MKPPAADTGPSCQTEVDRGRTQLGACTGEWASPVRARLCLNLARPRASPRSPAFCWAPPPTSSSRCSATWSPRLCRTTAASWQPWARTLGGGRRCIWPEVLCSLRLLICCTNYWLSGTNNNINNTGCCHGPHCTKRLTLVFIFPRRVVFTGVHWILLNLSRDGRGVRERRLWRIGSREWVVYDVA